MSTLAERAWFRLCLFLGRLLRSAKYSTVRLVDQEGELQVRKQRRFYAPLLVTVGAPLARFLQTGVRVLPQREWHERERVIYRDIHGTSIRVEHDVLVLPGLRGETLATLLEDARLPESDRRRAIELAVVALVDFHRMGFTHGDAMAENVMIDLDAGVAHWFDFETLHDPGRSKQWCRADDVRALLATSLLRTPGDIFADTFQLVLDVYGDDEVTQLLAASFRSALRRPLSFHLGQAPLSHRHYREIARLLRERLGG
jgi:hypothetical protein